MADGCDCVLFMNVVMAPFQKQHDPFVSVMHPWCALAGIRTRVNCLASSYAACYTTNAPPELPLEMPARDDTSHIWQAVLCVVLRLHGHGHYIPQGHLSFLFRNVWGFFVNVIFFSYSFFSSNPVTVWVDSVV